MIFWTVIFPVLITAIFQMPKRVSARIGPTIFVERVKGEKFLGGEQSKTGNSERWGELDRVLCAKWSSATEAYKVRALIVLKKKKKTLRALRERVNKKKLFGLTCKRAIITFYLVFRWFIREWFSGFLAHCITRNLPINVWTTSIDFRGFNSLLHSWGKLFLTILLDFYLLIF